MVDLARRAALFGRTKPLPPPLRPPGALDAHDFESACNSCGDCERACPQNIIFIGDGGQPELTFSKAGCTSCGECQRACPTSALSGSIELRDRTLPSILDRCFNRQGVYCDSCRDACEIDVIRVKPRLGGTVEIRIELDQCTACGQCVSVCPADAIAMESMS